MDLAGLQRTSEQFVLGPGLAESAHESTLSPAALRFLGALLQSLQPRLVLEFGSGLSTRLILQVLREIPDAQLVSIDDSGTYLEHTRTSLPAADLGRATLVHAPLRPFRCRGKLFLTYSTRALARSLPSRAADVILIDGPLAFRYGREAVLYAARRWLRDGTVVVLDDAGREPEQAALAHWRALWGDDCEIEVLSDLGNGMAVVTIHGAAGWSRTRSPAPERLASWARTTHTLLGDLIR